jgi:hypothetical protein
MMHLLGRDGRVARFGRGDLPRLYCPISAHGKGRRVIVNPGVVGSISP